MTSDIDLKKLVKIYCIVCGHKGLHNTKNNCECDLSNIMYCNSPEPSCKIIFKKVKDNDDN